MKKKIFDDLVKIVNTVGMCDKHKISLINKLEQYFEIKDECNGNCNCKCN